MSKPSTREAPRRRKEQYSLRVVKILRGAMFGAKMTPGPQKSPRAKKEPPRTAVFAESGANFKKIEKIHFQKIANRRDGSATKMQHILELIATPTKRGHF